MTIVIPYLDDILSGVELRFALRSIDKYLTGWTNVVIIGTPPEWYNGESVKAKDYRNRKQYSIYSKLLVACELNNVTDNFVMWNDDHYLLKPMNVGLIDAWYDGFLKDTVNKNHGARYKETIANTLQIIPDTLNYDIHTPCIYNKGTFSYLFEKKTEEICIKSSYFHRYSINDTYMKDFKINQLLSKEAIKELIKDRLFLSTSTNGMKKPMIELLSELYPNKSQWEI